MAWPTSSASTMWTSSGASTTQTDAPHSWQEIRLLMCCGHSCNVMLGGTTGKRGWNFSCSVLIWKGYHRGSPPFPMEDEAANKRGWVEGEPQEPPSSIDFIRSIPGKKLVTIMSLLPIKSAKQTTILSRRWRPLWHSTPLDLLDDEELCSRDRKYLDALFHILATHTTPVRRLAIIKFRSNCKVEPNFHEWFLSFTLDKVEELRFVARHRRLLPPYVLRLVPTLHHAMFMGCFSCKINAAHALHFLKLKHHELIGIIISKQDLEHVLDGCTMLEYLHPKVMFRFSGLHIAMTNLHMIYVHGWCRNTPSVGVFHDMIIENAPFLERLFVLDKEGQTRIGIIDISKLTCWAISMLNSSNLLLLDPYPFRYNCLLIGAGTCYTNGF
ncbi:hypothetical protein D1007_18508 [Hordeum vulgare]|nr:hypothetical protein D1007_18508 [Hordeum vulgare]